MSNENWDVVFFEPLPGGVAEVAVGRSGRLRVRINCGHAPMDRAQAKRLAEGILEALATAAEARSDGED